MKRFLVPLLMVFAIAALLMATVPANAAFNLMLDDGSTSVLITDGGVNDINPVTGVITYLGAVGTNWTVNVSTGISKPIIGPVKMDMNSVDVSLGAGTLDIWLTDTDFNLPLGSYPSFSNAIGGTTVGTVYAQGGIDTWNWEFYLESATPWTAYGSGAFSGTTYGMSSYAVDGPVSLTEHIQIVHTAGGSTSFDKELSVPEPATMLLIGTGLLGLAGLGRRRKLFKK